MKRSPRSAFQMSLFEQEVVSVQFVAQLLGLSGSGVKRLLDDGKLRSYQHTKPGGTHYILRSSLDEYEAYLRREFALDPPHTNGTKGAKRCR